ncbi:GNAT family N-acetyltransferase/peptidase C39 family protein [Coraliomargarita parva]|uniref:GNAT family N-acetyltransferase/peptidase C39 family protein n=1 Tax=Coraliomargarita parva TaxID=3014050 RepID=UPI0022B521DA|nr:peptidase C39 family protein [Coraliomargarita parva]
MRANLDIQPADKHQIDTLVALENDCFETDRLTRRNFQWMLSKGNASLLIASYNGELKGYVLTLFHKGTSLARIYSMAVDADSRRRGIGDALLKAAETEARTHDCLYSRLEVRRDNLEAIQFYQNRGYREFETWANYYEDHEDALRYEKRIRIESPATQTPVPYYAQTTEFTCGPASLMMAMAALSEDYQCRPSDELQLWREATTIFMTSGHGGCGPRGLALAAHARGFKPEIYVSRDGPLFLDGVRNPMKKEVLLRVHADFKARCKEAGIPFHRKALGIQQLQKHLDAGALILVLISSYRLYGEKAPHWVVITGYSDRFVFFNDPSVDHEAHETETDRMNIPMLLGDFAKMAQFGRSQVKAAVVIAS